MRSELAAAGQSGTEAIGRREVRAVAAGAVAARCAPNSTLSAVAAERRMRLRCARLALGRNRQVPVYQDLAYRASFGAAPRVDGWDGAHVRDESDSSASDILKKSSDGISVAVPSRFTP